MRKLIREFSLDLGIFPDYIYPHTKAVTKKHTPI